MEAYCVTCEKILQTKILASEELNKIDQCLYKLVLFVAKTVKAYLKSRSEWIMDQIKHQNSIK